MGVVTINQRSIKIFTISLRYKDNTPYDLSNATEIAVSLPYDDPNAPDQVKQQFLLSQNEVEILSPLGGKVQVTCSGLKTEFLKPGEEQDGEILIVNAGDTANPVIIDLLASFTINKRLFTSS